MKSNDEWMSISDMMAGLMMIFMLIAITFMLQTEQEKQAMADVALTYEKTQTDLYQALREEFDDDLSRWGAELLPDTTIRFLRPEVLFDVNSAQLRQQFEAMLTEFFPRYVAILSQTAFVEEVLELRIEGHTSSDWKGAENREEAYLKNANLSQKRSFAVLDFVFSLPDSQEHRNWLIKTLRANGLSFARPILSENGQAEDSHKSRRVEFRVITNTEEKIREILRQQDA